MNNEERMKELAEKLVNTADFVEKGFPSSTIGKELRQGAEKFKETKDWKYLAEKIVETADFLEKALPNSTIGKELRQSSEKIQESNDKSKVASFFDAANGCLTDANIYRSWLLKSVMLDKEFVITPSHVDLLATLFDSVRALKFMEKEYPSKEAIIEGVTLFNE